jgi:hypothetical protein
MLKGTYLFGATIVSLPEMVHFPCKYLGVPLSIHKMKKSELQPQVNGVVDRLPTWKSWLMSRVGCMTLVKVTLLAIPIHVSITMSVSPWIYQDIDKLCRRFIWIDTDIAQGGECLVAWSRVTQPVELGGLGVLDLNTLWICLWLRWEWFAVAREWMRGKEGKRKGPREEKKGVGFQTRLTDELRRTVPHPPWPRIFVGWATSPMNLCILSSSVTRPNRRIYG